MAVTVQQAFSSPEVGDGERSGATLAFIVSGTSDYDTALDALNAAVPSVVRNMGVVATRIEVINFTTWRGEADYGINGEPSQFEFDTTGGSTHIQQSLETVGSYTVEAAQPDHQGAIGVARNGGSYTIEGTDVIVPVYSFSETHRLSTGSVTAAYKAEVFGLTGRINNAPFKGFKTGEVLFFGARGSLSDGMQWEISYSFAASPNITGLTIGQINGIEKKGWEYLWVQYREQEDTDSFTIVMEPRSVFIERVYDAGDMSKLLIGVI